MRVVNNKKKYKCYWCDKEIVTRRKVEWSNRRYYHLSCLYDYAVKQLEKWREVKNTLSKYKRDFVMEKLK